MTIYSLTLFVYRPKQLSTKRPTEDLNQVWTTPSTYWRIENAHDIAVFVLKTCNCCGNFCLVKGLAFG